MANRKGAKAMTTRVGTHSMFRGLQTEQCAVTSSFNTTYNAIQEVLPYTGIMFSIFPNTALDILSLELDLRLEDNPDLSVEVYIFRGRFATISDNPELWSKVADTTAVPAPEGVGAIIPVGDFTPVSLAKNERVSFFVNMKIPVIDYNVAALKKTDEIAIELPDFDLFVGAGRSETGFGDLDSLVDPQFTGIIHYSRSNECGQVTTTVTYYFIVNENLRIATLGELSAIVDTTVNDIMLEDDGILDLQKLHGLRKIGETQINADTFNGSCPFEVCSLLLTTTVDFVHDDSLTDGEVKYAFLQYAPHITNIALQQLGGVQILYVGPTAVAALFSLSLSGVPPGSMNTAQQDYFTDVTIDFLSRGSSDAVLDLQIDEQVDKNGSIQIIGRLLGASYQPANGYANDLEELFRKGQASYLSQLVLDRLRPRGIAAGDNVEFFQGITSVGGRVNVDFEAPTPAPLSGEGGGDDGGGSSLIIIIAAAAGGVVIFLLALLLCRRSMANKRVEKRELVDYRQRKKEERQRRKEDKKNLLGGHEDSESDKSEMEAPKHVGESNETIEVSLSNSSASQGEEVGDNPAGLFPWPVTFDLSGSSGHNHRKPLKVSTAAITASPAPLAGFMDAQPKVSTKQFSSARTVEPFPPAEHSAKLKQVKEAEDINPSTGERIRALPKASKSLGAEGLTAFGFTEMFSSQANAYHQVRKGKKPLQPNVKELSPPPSRPNTPASTEALKIFGTTEPKEKTESPKQKPPLKSARSMEAIPVEKTRERAPPKAHKSLDENTFHSHLQDSQSTKSEIKTQEAKRATSNSPTEKGTTKKVDDQVDAPTKPKKTPLLKSDTSTNAPSLEDTPVEKTRERAPPKKHKSLDENSFHGLLQGSRRTNNESKTLDTGGNAAASPAAMARFGSSSSSLTKREAKRATSNSSKEKGTAKTADDQVVASSESKKLPLLKGDIPSRTHSQEGIPVEKTRERAPPKAYKSLDENTFHGLLRGSRSTHDESKTLDTGGNAAASPAAMARFGSSSSSLTKKEANRAISNSPKEKGTKKFSPHP